MITQRPDTGRRRHLPSVAVVGAGHVGAAVASTLSRLPLALDAGERRLLERSAAVVEAQVA